MKYNLRPRPLKFNPKYDSDSPYTGFRFPPAKRRILKNEIHKLIYLQQIEQLTIDLRSSTERYNQLYLAYLKQKKSIEYLANERFTLITRLRLIDCRQTQNA